MEEPIYADFNNRDEDDAVRIFPPHRTVADEELDIQLTEGKPMWLSDGEVEVRGVLTFRDGIWVVIPNEDGFRYVDEKASYHNKNQTGNK